MNNLGSPFNIGLLLHYHVSPEPHPRSDLPLVQSTISELLRAGAIQPDAGILNVYTTTPLGKAWVTALCNVPPPTQVFVDESGRILK